MCGIGPIPSPCIIICYDDCAVCYVDFPSRRSKAFVDLDSEVLNGVKPPKLDASTKLQFCCNGASLERIAEFLNKVHPAAKVQPPKVYATVSETMSGTLGEIVKKLGLEAY
jgi:hypothetical protein